MQGNNYLSTLGLRSIKSLHKISRFLFRLKIITSTTAFTIYTSYLQITFLKFFILQIIVPGSRTVFLFK